MNKYICEFIGTFFLVLTVGSTVIDGGEGVIPPLAIGSVLMVMIFATGHVSGGHLNPAVTLAVWMRGKCDTRDVPGYMIGQIAGGVAAAYLVLFMKGQPTVTPLQFASPVVPMIAEFLGAFAIAFVVLNVATAKANHNNSFYGLAIGFTVVALAFALGGYSGGAFNPAVALGITAMGLVTVSSVWIHLVGSLAGGAVAAILFKLLSPEDARRSVVAPPDTAR
ncbi:MAG: aquaporin family protein [Chthoniobacterales bacterium]|nr:aquaporin family protein [Chthoniobacterales bacterium]